MNNVHLVTQEKKTSQNGSKMGRVHRVHCPRPARAPRPRACGAPAAHAPRAPHAAACCPRACRALPRARASRLHAQRPACALRARPARLASAQPAPSTTIHLSHNTQSVSRHTWAVAQFYFFCTKNLFIFHYS